MTTRHLKWTAAFAVSTALHAGAVGLFMMPSDESVQIAGGQPVVLSSQGTAMEDLTSAGEIAEAVEPTDTAEAVEPEQEIAAVQPETVQPERTEPEPAQEIEPVQSEAVEPEPVETPPEPTEQAVPVPPDAVPPPEAPDTAAVEPETLAPLPEDELALVDVPIPTARPEYTPPPPPRQQAQRTERPRQQQAAPRQQGSGGQNQADTRRGAEQGGASGASAPSGQSAQSNAAGNAAVSNYPGQVATRLRRALQYPRDAQRQGIRGEVHVRFTVNASGQAAGITVARSSGHAVLDQAAVATVQRASPFPAIPAAAARSSWPFTVPLVFSR